MQPTLGNGKICYLEMPAKDLGESAAFYRDVFGWNVRTRGDGSIAFDDGVGQVSGTWTTARKPVAEPGVLIYIMVDSLKETIDRIKAHGGEIVQPCPPESREIIATFRDPAGNLFGLYQNR